MFLKEVVSEYNRDAGLYGKHQCFQLSFLRQKEDKDGLLCKSQIENFLRKYCQIVLKYCEFSLLFKQK